jgi:phosphatidylglycerol:prolipoprotein diacylglycerol transferase
MFPYLIIGPFKIPMFMLMAAVGLAAFLITAIVLVEKIEKTERKTVNWMLIACVIGFGILYGSAYVMNSLFHSIAEKKIILGGITWLGGVLVAFPSLAVLIHFLCPRAKGNALFYFNLLIPAIVLGHAFGRIGCFCGGCCYGGRTDSFLGVSFPPHSPAAHAQHANGLIGHNDWSLPVYPTQLIEAAVELVIFAVMMIFYKKLKYHFAETYCFGYGTARFAMEFLRDDNRGSTGFFLTPSQFMSILLIVFGVLLILYHKRIIFKKLYDKMQQYRKETALYGVHLQADVTLALWRLESLQKDGLLSETEYAETKKLFLERLSKKPITEEEPTPDVSKSEIPEQE